MQLWRRRARTTDRATAKGMMPLNPEENRWRRASFGIETPTARPLTGGSPNLYRNTVAASAVITLHYPHGLGYGSQDQSEVHSPLSDHCDLAVSVSTAFQYYMDS